jgi:hypothetical protein
MYRKTNIYTEITNKIITNYYLNLGINRALYKLYRQEIYITK